MKTLNTYPEFSEFENRLIKRIAGCLARRLNLSRQDREDVEQDLAICLWRKKDEYDPDHISGSRYETYITTYLEKQALEIQKNYIRDHQNPERPAEDDTPDGFDISGNGFMGPVEKQAILRADLASVISKLTPEQKRLVGCLASGASIPEAALELGLTYDTAYSRVKRLRAIFRRHGFNGSLN